MHEIGFSERKYARRRGGVFNFLLSHFSFQSIFSRKSYEQFFSNLGFAGTIKKKKFKDISDVLGKDILMSYFVFMSVSSSHIAVWGSIPERFYYCNHIILLVCLLRAVYFKLTNQ